MFGPAEARGIARLRDFFARVLHLVLVGLRMTGVLHLDLGHAQTQKDNKDVEHMVGIAVTKLRAAEAAGCVEVNSLDRDGEGLGRTIVANVLAPHAIGFDQKVPRPFVKDDGHLSKDSSMSGCMYMQRGTKCTCAVARELARGTSRCVP